jgi:hypothetical protein
LDKVFTVSEAESLLPVVEALLKQAQAAAGRVQKIEEELAELKQRIFLLGGMQVNIVAAARLRAQHDKLTTQAKDAVSEIEAAGVMVKDVEKGLADFPAMLEGQLVLLCWKIGEKEIGYWHSVEEGYAGRKPLDSRFRSGSDLLH